MRKLLILLSLVIIVLGTFAHSFGLWNETLSDVGKVFLTYILVRFVYQLFKDTLEWINRKWPKKKKYYQKTFMTKVRKITTDREKAEKSRFVWKEEYSSEKGIHFTTSYLGMLNGLLRKFGYQLGVWERFGVIEEYDFHKIRK